MRHSTTAVLPFDGSPGGSTTSLGRCTESFEVLRIDLNVGTTMRAFQEDAVQQRPEEYTSIVTKAYRQRSLTVHPDKGGTDDGFKELGRAKDWLMVPSNAVFEALLHGPAPEPQEEPEPAGLERVVPGTHVVAPNHSRSGESEITLYSVNESKSRGTAGSAAGLTKTPRRADDSHVAHTGGKNSQ